MSRRAQHGPRRLFWSVFLHGVLILLLVGLAVAVVGFVFERRAPWRAHTERFTAHMAARLAELPPESAALERELRRFREELDVEATLYTNDGRLLATTAQPPIPPLRHRGLRELDRGPLTRRGPRWTVAAPLWRGGERVGYVVARPSWAEVEPRWLRALAALLAVMLALGLASAPLARRIVAPLERLREAVRRFGEGELSARAGLERRDELGELGRAFDEMAARLERSIRAEKELLANVSHELRTPLARIRVALELIQEGDGERAQRYLKELGADVLELEGLVDDVLTTARLDLGKGTTGGAPPLRKERVPAGELVREAGERFGAAHPARPFELHLEPELPSLDADRVLLRRAIENLLDNADKYSPAGEVVTLAARRASDAASVEIEVRDRGPGIAAEDLPHVFTPFFRGDRSRTRGTGGVGLGLALVARIVEGHGGSVDARNHESGAVFRIALPIA